MEPTGPRRQPDLVQRFLQIDDDLAAVGKGQRDHATHALVVDVGIGLVVDAVTRSFHLCQQAFGLVHVFKVGHYNRRMLSIARILVIGHLLAGLAAMLSACGQKGALVLPTTAESQGRATLPQTLNPWHKPAQAAASAASEPAR